jgi:hypothetical protein
LERAGHGEGAALKHLSEHVPDDILHPVVITALGIHIELVFSAAPGLLLSSNTEPSRLDHRVLVRMSSNPAVPTRDDRGNQ